MSARIVLERVENPWVDRARAYKVLVDGEAVGKIRRGETLRVNVDPGTHKVHLAIDWTTSNTMTLDLGPADEAHLVCSPSASASRPRKLLRFLTSDRQNYIRLEHVDPDRSDALP